MTVGKVYLVGAGPGDIELITVKAKRHLMEADVILYDRLINPLLLSIVRSEAELIYVGKLPDRHILRQDAINDLLVEKAKEGKKVVRLKGGDPSVFGRVGEEAEELALHDIPYEIVPGVTSSIAAASYAGIPVTHREYGYSFAVVTGHDKSKSGQPLIDWAALSGIDTIAFYMGVGNIQYITEQLISNGRTPETPVILIQWGTYSRQRTLEGTIGTIAEKVKETKFSNPAITLVGNIVDLRKKLAWFEKTPLFGKQIMVARTSNENSKLTSSLVEHGAEVFHYPAYKVDSIVEKAGKEFKDITNAKNIFFLSPESIDYFFEGLAYHQIDIRFIQAKLFVGSVKSKRKLTQYGCLSESVEELNRQDPIVTIGGQMTERKKEKLKQQLGDFTHIVTHEQVIDSNKQMICNRVLEEGTVTTLLFPSAASVEAFMLGLQQLGRNPLEEVLKWEIICFGEKSTKAAKENGFHTVETLAEPSIDSLVNHLSQSNQLAVE
ncbi:uroporphyrinogen-III C-methyltransferase [Bacillus alkalicellulosilyticus]|uniref:uroporphyrinogen-III C-methyltransferase n=1 Tax=Alkalihalobacterium alkalicellulosilyticum TaxID=1912214 RepID=UPI000995EC7A|nr:uroporphyrinogen-III C-methyltransferase [Bacillus alkalicellulosilyticus]